MTMALILIIDIEDDELTNNLLLIGYVLSQFQVQTKSVSFSPNKGNLGKIPLWPLWVVT